MKRILLVSPARGDFIDRFEDRRTNHMFELPRALMPPLDLATIAALTPPDIELDIWDESVREQIDDSTDLGKDYDLIGVTGYIANIPRALALAEVAHRRGIPAAIGGPGVSGSPETCRGVFDVIFIGEAELTWPQFLEDWQAGKHRSEYRQVQRPDIARSPAPRWDGIEDMPKNYFIGAVQTTRGCPFDCEFCDVIHLFGRQPRHKPVDTILDEVTALQRLGMRMIFFCDDNFIGHPKYTKELLRALIPLNNSFECPLAFTTQLTINLAKDDEQLQLLADANFYVVHVGIESPREQSLREVHKIQNCDMDLVEAVRKIQSYGVLVKGNIIVGFDHDDLGIFDEVYDFLRDSCLLNVAIYSLSAFPGTPLLARLQREGRIVEIGEDSCSDKTRASLSLWTNIIPKQMTRVELMKGYKRLTERVHSWDHFGACAKEMLKNIKRVPRLPEKASRDPGRLGAARGAMETLDVEARAVILDVLQTVQEHAPFMMRRMLSALFRFGAFAGGLPSLMEALQKRIDIESADDFRLEVVQTRPRVPAGFRNAMRRDAFSLTYDGLTSGLTDKSLVPEGLIRVWKGFLIRWGESFEKFEDYHYEHLRELCDRTIEQGNSGEFSNARTNAQVDGLSAGQLRRLAGEVLVSVEQDLRGIPQSESVASGAGIHETVGH